MQEVVGSTPIFSTSFKALRKRGPFFMSFFVYILYSKTVDQYYIGHTEDLEDRLKRHVNHGSKATKKANDWVVVFTEGFNTKSEAFQREMEIKRKKSRKFIEWLISTVG